MVNSDVETFFGFAIVADASGGFPLRYFGVFKTLIRQTVPIKEIKSKNGIICVIPFISDAYFGAHTILCKCILLTHLTTTVIVNRVKYKCILIMSYGEYR